MTRLVALPLLAVALALATAASAGAVRQAAFVLASPAFEAGGTIPAKYTCDGANTIVPLTWSGAPAGTKSFALIVDDPDAPLPGGFLHRLAWGIPGTAKALRGKAPVDGANGTGAPGWIGPCPPSGNHHYVFRLYALKSPLPLEAGAERSAFDAALKGQSLGVAKLVGRYSRG